MIGIRFTYIAKNAGQHFLGLLLNAVNIEDFIWQIDESDIYIYCLVKVMTTCLILQ